MAAPICVSGNDVPSVIFPMNILRLGFITCIDIFAVGLFCKIYTLPLRIKSQNFFCGHYHSDNGEKERGSGNGHRRRRGRCRLRDFPVRLDALPPHSRQLCRSLRQQTHISTWERRDFPIFLPTCGKIRALSPDFMIAQRTKRPFGTVQELSTSENLRQSVTSPKSNWAHYGTKCDFFSD